MTNNSFPFLREGGFDFTKEIKDGRVKYFEHAACHFYLNKKPVGVLNPDWAVSLNLNNKRT
jgi:hypothetical protein